MRKGARLSRWTREGSTRSGWMRPGRILTHKSRTFACSSSWKVKRLSRTQPTSRRGPPVAWRGARLQERGPNGSTVSTVFVDEASLFSKRVWVRRHGGRRQPTVNSLNLRLEETRPPFETTHVVRDVASDAGTVADPALQCPILPAPPQSDVLEQLPTVSRSTGIDPRYAPGDPTVHHE